MKLLRFFAPLALSVALAPLALFVPPPVSANNPMFRSLAKTGATGPPPEVSCSGSAICDTFTTSNGNSLASRIPNVGSAWTDTTAAIIWDGRVVGGACQTSLNETTLTSANYTTEVKYTYVGALAEWYEAIPLRSQGNGTVYRARLYKTGGTSNIQVEWHYEGGGGTAMTATYDFSPTVGQSFVLSFGVVGEDFTVKLDGATILTFNNNATSGAGKTGLLQCSSATQTSGLHVDYIKTTY